MKLFFFNYNSIVLSVLTKLYVLYCWYLASANVDGNQILNLKLDQWTIIKTLCVLITQGPTLLSTRPQGDDVIPGCASETLNCQNWSGSSVPKTSHSARRRTRGQRASARPLKPHTHTFIRLTHKHTHAYIRFIYKRTYKLFILHTPDNYGCTLILNRTSWLLCLCQSGGARGSKYNRRNTTSPAPKWPTLDLGEDSGQKLRRHQDLPINRHTLTSLWIHLLARGCVSVFNSRDISGVAVEQKEKERCDLKYGNPQWAFIGTFHVDGSAGGEYLWSQQWDFLLPFFRHTLNEGAKGFELHGQMFCEGVCVCEREALTSRCLVLTSTPPCSWQINRNPA